MNEWQNVFARLIDLGTTYYEQRQPQPALTALTEAVSIAEDKGDEPKLGQALLLRGAVRQVVQQQYDAALADYLRLTNRPPELVDLPRASLEVLRKALPPSDGLRDHRS